MQPIFALVGPNGQIKDMHLNERTVRKKVMKYHNGSSDFVFRYTPEICSHCAAPSVTNLDGENLCQTHADNWARGEWCAALETATTE